jgi:hypothetical protein
VGCCGGRSAARAAPTTADHLRQLLAKPGRHFGGMGIDDIAPEVAFDRGARVGDDRRCSGLPEDRLFANKWQILARDL